MKKIFIAALAIATILVIALFGTGLYMLTYSLTPSDSRSDMTKAYTRLYKEHPDMKQWTDSIRENKLLRDTFIIMPNGEKHHALYLRNDSAKGRTAIIVHGYKDCAPRFLTIARIYHQQANRNILLPDLHGHGLSEGDDIQMGWKDRHDIIHWTKVADKMFADSSYRSSIVLHGISMGAATVMNISGDESAPENIDCIVEDCGYSSVWDEFAVQLHDQFSLPEFPVMHISSMLCKMRHGWSFSEASSLRQISKFRFPILFIHGDADTFVPFNMLRPLYDAARQPKEKWVVKGARHAEAYKKNPQEYARRIIEFTNKYER